MMGEKYEIHKADIRDWYASYTGPKFHAVLCDPPYHLGDSGFMNMKWDSAKQGVAFQPETWAGIMEHLHPGAFLMAYGGTRTYHRMAVAIEDAGFVLHSALVWAFGSGFPKATRIDDQVDAAAGAEREVVSEWHMPGRGSRNQAQKYGLTNDSGVTTAPATPLAATWQGHRYGRQALKPAAEFICVAQKPYVGRPVDCITQTGAGALWIDGGRVEADGDDLARNNLAGDNGWKNSSGGPNGAALRAAAGLPPQGRWPANLILSDDAAARLDAQSGKVFSGVTLVSENDTSWYNNSQEVSLCKEIASIAESLSTHVQQMLHGGSADFAAASAGTPTTPNPEAIGSTSGKTKADGMSNGDSQAVEKFTQGDGPSGSGSKPTGHFRPDMKFITSTSTRLMTVLKTSKQFQSESTRNFTVRLEQITNSLTVLSAEGVNDATSTSRLLSSIHELLELTTAIASHAEKNTSENGERKTGNTITSTPGNTSENGASRFFQVVSEQIDAADPLYYTAKASTWERNAGLAGRPQTQRDASRNAEQPSMNGGDGNPYNRGAKPVTNHHPTVKPVSLNVHLATLLLPPKEYAPRRILVPFCGVASELIGSLLAGWDYAVGVERDDDGGYIDIAEARLRYWTGARRHLTGTPADVEGLPLLAALEAHT